VTGALFENKVSEKQTDSRLSQVLDTKKGYKVRMKIVDNHITDSLPFLKDVEGISPRHKSTVDKTLNILENGHVDAAY
jgi:hypothetical protein